MPSFSKPPQEVLEQNVKAGYVGLHIGEGVPVLDRDLNLLQDLLHKMVRDVVAYYIGDVVIADGDGFRISAADTATDNFDIGKGKCLAGGFVVANDQQRLTYKEQLWPKDDLKDKSIDFSSWSKLLVYLDVWLREVGEKEDTELGNSDDIGIATSTRLLPEWRVRVQNGEKLPDPWTGHTYHPLARITRQPGNAAITQDMITDLRQLRPVLSANIEQRLQALEGLFRPSLASEKEFDPEDGRPDETVTVFGSNFDKGKIEVRFGNWRSDSFSIKDSTSIEAQVPSPQPPLTKDEPVNLVVRNEFGTARSRATYTIRPN